MNSRFRAVAAVLSLWLIAPSAFGQGSGNNLPRRPQTTEEVNVVTPSNILPRLPIEQFTLSNGLRVVMSRDNSVPVVAVAVYYDVGSRDERAGRTGFAHLFEHMMFQGSENVPKAAHFQFISNAGGTMNGTTSTERTNYFETLPANQLPLALWLESDRMRSLKITQENLDNQRKAVQEERRLRIDNQPYTPAFLRMSELVFKNPANAHSTIGSMEDLDAATVEDVREFFRIYYAPNNAVLSIVGDFDPQTARPLIEKYFGTIPRQSAPPKVDVNEPAEVAVRSETINDRFAQIPGFIIGWKVPPRRHADYYALDLASNLLLSGESSRLYQRLVKGDESALAVQGGYDERRGPSSLFIFALPKPGKDAEQIRGTIMSEIKRLATEGPTPAEMEKIRNNILNDVVRGFQSSMFRAQRLAEYAIYDGDPNLINTDIERYLSVTANQIKAATARYLDTDNRTVLSIVPARGDRPAAATQPSGEPRQPGAPAPQVPARPAMQPASPAAGGQPATPAQAPPADRPAQPQQPTDAPPQTQPGAQPKRP
ncbi:MAG: insulinase family protein [Acidobacteriota bacterium]|nr:insulinase family protein [Acidobacteriota bacterium]